MSPACSGAPDVSTLYFDVEPAASLRGSNIGSSDGGFFRDSSD